MNASLVYAVCMALCGAFTALIPLAIRQYYLLSSIAGAFGFFIAANYSLTSIILVEAITLERFTNAYGLLLLVQGIANLMGPPLAGNYTRSFCRQLCESNYLRTFCKVWKCLRLRMQVTAIHFNSTVLRKSRQLYHFFYLCNFDL